MRTRTSLVGRNSLLAVLFVASVLTVSAEPQLSIDEIADQMRLTETIPGSLTGTETDTVFRAGVLIPDLKDYSMQAAVLDGTYRWYARGSDWWTVKTIPIDVENKLPGTNTHVVRNYEDQILSYTDFKDRQGQHSFLAAHLDRQHNLYSIGPLLGRRWSSGSISLMLREMKDVRMSQVTDGIQIVGTYKGATARLKVVPRYGYLVTSLITSNKTWRAGFDITKVRQIGDAWMPEEAQRYSGRYSGDQLVMGYEAQIRFADFAPHGVPTAEEVPPIPAGSMMGSDGGRLYRVTPEGKLVDWGRMGRKPNATLAWGNIFVLSGAGLLLGSLSWIFFRNRRASAPSPSPRR